MTAEDEGVIVHSCDWSTGRCADVGKDGFACGVGTNALKIGVVERGLSVLIESGMFGFYIVVEVHASMRVPCNSKSIHIEEPITDIDFMLRGDLMWIMRE